MQVRLLLPRPILRSRPTGRTLAFEVRDFGSNPNPAARHIRWRSSEAEQAIDNRPAASSNLAATTRINDEVGTMNAEVKIKDFQFRVQRSSFIVSFRVCSSDEESSRFLPGRSWV
jgi:hypothetical protein